MYLDDKLLRSYVYIPPELHRVRTFCKRKDGVEFYGEYQQ